MQSMTVAWNYIYHWDQRKSNNVLRMQYFDHKLLFRKECCCRCCWSLLYSTILCSWAGSLHSHVILNEWLALYSAFLNIHWSGVLPAPAWLVSHETAALSAQVLRTPYNHAPCHFMQSHIRKVHAYLAVTCHQHFWQTDWGLLCATVVTRGWNRYRNKSHVDLP